MSKVIASIDDVAVIATEPATGPHPHPAYDGQIVTFTGVTRALLEDGTERFICDNCDKPWDNIRSAVAHLTSHSPTKNDPDMSQDLIKSVVRAVRRISEDDRHRFQKAADALNWAGVKTTRGKEWTGQNVRSVFNRYGSTVRVRVTRPKLEEHDAPQPVEINPIDVIPAQTKREIADSLDAVATALTETPSRPEDVKNVFANLRIQLKCAQAQLVELGEQVTNIASSLEGLEVICDALVESGEIDPEILEKARKYDVLREHLS